MIATGKRGWIMSRFHMPISDDDPDQAPFYRGRLTPITCLNWLNLIVYQKRTTWGIAPRQLILTNKAR